MSKEFTKELSKELKNYLNAWCRSRHACDFDNASREHQLEAILATIVVLHGKLTTGRSPFQVVESNL